MSIYNYDHSLYLKDRGTNPIYDYNQYLTNKKYYDKLIIEYAEVAHDNILKFMDNDTDPYLNYPGKESGNLRMLSSYLIPTLFSKKHPDHKIRMSALNNALNFKIDNQYPHDISIRFNDKEVQYCKIGERQQQTSSHITTADKHFFGAIKKPEKRLKVLSFCKLEYVPQNFIAWYEKYSVKGLFNVESLNYNMHYLFDLIATDIIYFHTGESDNDKNRIEVKLSFNNTKNLTEIIKSNDTGIHINKYYVLNDKTYIYVDLYQFLGG
jgi:hypothetical protein